MKPSESSYRAPSLRARNLSAGILYLLQAVLAAIVIAPVVPLLLPVTLSYPTTAPGSGMPFELVAVTSVNAPWGAIAVLLLSALTSFAVVVPVLRSWYEAAIDRGHNPLRSAEFAVSSAIMVFVIAQLNGISNAATLVAIYTIQSAAVMLFWLHERFGATLRSAQPFVFACAVGIVPWGLIALHVFAPGATSGFDQPLWVRVLTVSMLVFYVAIAVIQWRGPRAESGARNHHNERWQIVLSLVMKSAFTWQVVAGVLSSAAASATAFVPAVVPIAAVPIVAVPFVAVYWL